MHFSMRFLSIIPAVTAFGIMTQAQERHDHPAGEPCPVCDANASRPSTAQDVNWLTGEGDPIGGVLFPHMHGIASFGDSTADAATLANGHHDPDRDGWTIQNVEFGASGRFSEHFETFTTYAAKIGLDDRWSGEFEEWFGKIKGLPGGLELRGGRYYNRFGLHNHVHPHGFDFVDQFLVSGRFLGDDSLTTIGGEVSWKLPVSWTSLVSVSVGVAPEREEHEHGEEDEGHDFEGEGAMFNDTFVTANWTNQRDYNDFHQFRFGASGAWGDNESGKTTQIYGVHLEYLWRQNGYEAGGSYFRWRTEAMLRAFDAVAEPHGHEDEHEGGEEHEDTKSGSFHEAGLYTALAYGFDNGLEFGLRGEFVSGIAEAGLDERFRLSPAVTCYFNKARTLYLRGQYNYDHSSDFGDESSVWLQIGFNWGGTEVR